MRRTSKQFLRLDSTRAALNVREDSAPWESCNMKVNSDFTGDWMKEFDGLIGPMLEDGVSVLIYSGDCDWICNYMGNEAWTLSLDWAGGDGFRAAQKTDWSPKDSNAAAGVSRSFGGLTFLQVYEAGHMVSGSERGVKSPVAGCRQLALAFFSRKALDGSFEDTPLSFLSCSLSDHGALGPLFAFRALPLPPSPVTPIRAFGIFLVPLPPPPNNNPLRAPAFVTGAHGSAGSRSGHAQRIRARGVPPYPQGFSRRASGWVGHRRNCSYLVSW